MKKSMPDFTAMEKINENCGIKRQGRYGKTLVSVNLAAAAEKPLI